MNSRNAAEIQESELVFKYFQCRARGFFVDIGANHPTERSQTWFLEQQGWTGILVEPNPRLCRLLREQRPRSQVCEMALCAPENVGEANLHLGVSDRHSALKPEPGMSLTTETIRVKMATLDSVLESARVTGIDFVSLDVERMELDVLRGFDLARWQPKLILIEEMFLSYAKHRYLKQHGYKLVRRTGYNNWYVPRATPVSVFSLSTPRELFRLGRKFWLSTPYNNLRWRWQRRRYRPEPGTG